MSKADISPTPIRSRRAVLAGIVAAAAVPIATALATAAPVATAATPTEADPIYSIIESHRAAFAAHIEAVRVEYGYEQDTVLVSKMKPEQLKQYRIFEEATSAAADHLDEVSADLVNTKPITLAGIVALCRYLEPLLNETDTTALPEAIFWDDDTQSTPAGAFANVIAAAIGAITSQSQG